MRIALPLLLVIASVISLCTRELIVLGPWAGSSIEPDTELSLGLASESVCVPATGHCGPVFEEGSDMPASMVLLFVLWAFGAIAGTTIATCLRWAHNAAHPLEPALAWVSVFAFLVITAAGQLDLSHARPRAELWLMLSMPLSLLLPTRVSSPLPAARSRV